MKFEITLGENDREYGETLILDMSKLDEDTDCDTLIAWEEEADFSLHQIKLMSDAMSARWKKTLVWFALKQSGSGISYEDFKPRGLGGLAVRRVKPGDADPPESSGAASEPAS